MTDLLTTIVDGLREDFGQPATLLRLLDSTPALRVDLPPPPPWRAERLARGGQLL